MSQRTIVMPNLTSPRAKMHYVTALNELARLGLDTTRVELLAIGEHRNYRGEVHGQEPAPGAEIGPETQVRLEIGYPSAVDMLPHQFFTGLEHRPNAGREWEGKARRLMAPFDAAVMRHDAWALYRMLKVSFGFFDRGHVERYLTVFAITLPAVDFSDRELLLLAMLLPALHEWGGNAKAVAAALELFFGYSVELLEGVPNRFDIPARLRSRLGRAEGSRLGKDTLLGREFHECDSTYRLTFRGIDPEQLPEFLPGRPLRRKIDWFVRLITPNNLVCDLRLAPRRRQLRLGDRTGSFLGYATYVRSGARRALVGSST